jgi:hypothetical protein
MNKFDEMRQAMREAEQTLDAARSVASQMASMLVGKLRQCSESDLARLKRELRDFNIHTGRWRQ